MENDTSLIPDKAVETCRQGRANVCRKKKNSADPCFVGLSDSVLGLLRMCSVDKETSSHVEKMNHANAFLPVGENCEAEENDICDRSTSTSEIDPTNLIGASSCPFHTTEQNSEGDESSCLRSLIRNDRLLLEDEGSLSEAACPVFGGYAEMNAELFRSLGQESGVFHFSHDEESTKIKYSYTAKNPDFPNELQEDDLFGHSTNDGYLSKETGFVAPNYEEALSKLLQCRGRIWYDLGTRLAGLFSSNRLLIEVENMEIIDGDETACPDDCLHIASSILAHLSMGYRAACWRNKLAHEPAPGLEVPWRKICQRLGRKDTYCSVSDFVFQCRPLRGNSFESSNTEMITPLWNNRAEAIMSKLMCESSQHMTNMLPSILALCRGEWEASHIQHMIKSVHALTKMMGQVMPDESIHEWAIDPVDFAVSFVHATAPTKEGVPAVTAGACPIFAVLDIVLGRKEWNSQLGHDLLMQIEWMPKNWRRFIEYLRQKQLFLQVPNHLEYLWQLLKVSFVGDRGWLGQHKYRAFQFVELGTVLGRLPNTGNGQGEVAVQMLGDAMRERSPELCADRNSFKTCPFRGKIKHLKPVSADSNTQLVTIESSKPILICTGDHIAILMKNSDTSVLKFVAEHCLSPRDFLFIETGTLTEEWKERLDFDGLEYNVENVLKCAKLALETFSDVHITTENMCEMLIPEEPRLYSFATTREKDECVSTVDLLVSRVGPGGCSAFLFDSVGHDVSFGVSTGSRFSLPNNPMRPVVMIAAGSGIGTYLPILINEEVRHPKYAFLAYRTENTVPYLQAMEKAVSFGRLKLFVELSREDTSIVTEKRKLMHRKTKKRYLDALLKEQADLIHLLATPLSKGGMEGHFYVCGNNDFFHTIKNVLDTIDESMVPTLLSSSRLHLEVQARSDPAASKEESRSIALSEMCFHDTVNDFWVAIHGVVYDFTTYLPWHPGGSKVLQYLAGTDCSEQWDTVAHGKDRMIYSQLKTYEVGKYVHDESNLSKFLEFVTRASNCVRLYEDRDSLFENLCDSYGRVQAMFESVFGPKFIELSLLLETDVRRRLLQRLWFVKKGNHRVISDRMFKVSPLVDNRTGATHISVSSVGVGPLDALREANMEERHILKDRLNHTCNSFFLSCKRAITNVLTSGSRKDKDKKLSNMLITLVGLFEQLYSSLSSPIALSKVQKWNVIRKELKERKTFLLRFSVNSAIDSNFLQLISQTTPVGRQERHALVEKVLKCMEVGETPINRIHLGGTNMTDDWFEHADKLNIFNRIDKDGDGLISRWDVDGACHGDLEEAELEFLQFFKQSDVYRAQFTYSFVDFLEVIPEVAERNLMRQVSSLLFSNLPISR